MKQYPLIFEAFAATASGIMSRWTTGVKSFNQQLDAAIPPEFDGPGGGYSPEDFYVLALQNCFMATFKVFAEKSALNFSELQCAARLEVDRDPNGRPWMARLHLQARLSGVSQKEKAQRLLEKTSQSCMILNSVKTEKSFEFTIIEENGSAE